MRETDAVGKLAVKEITRWLKCDPNTRKVINLENDPEYQAKDIDLLWRTPSGIVTIEVKADRYDKTGNFFFETVSNKETGTPGCFLYTEADFVYYYFIVTKKLYILPMPATRDWFKSNLNSFKEISTRTSVRGGAYTTVGRLVKIERALRSVPAVKLVDLQNEFVKFPASRLLDRLCRFLEFRF
jgi:hypothetical protein